MCAIGQWAVNKSAASPDEIGTALHWDGLRNPGCVKWFFMAHDGSWRMAHPLYFLPGPSRSLRYGLVGYYLIYHHPLWRCGILVMQN